MEQVVKNDRSTQADKKKIALNDAQLERQRQKDREKVRGIFHYYEVPGGSMSFCFKEYKGDPIERYDLVDGQVYTIPLGVAKHLNKRCWYPQHEYAVNEEGAPLTRVSKKIRRCGFQSLEFIEDVDLNEVGGTGIVSVEHA